MGSLIRSYMRPLTFFLTEIIDVGKQCHDSCSTSATTRVRRTIANKKWQLSVEH